MTSLVVRHTNGRTIRYEAGTIYSAGGGTQLGVKLHTVNELHIPLSTVVSWYVDYYDDGERLPPWGEPIDEVV